MTALQSVRIRGNHHFTAALSVIAGDCLPLPALVSITDYPLTTDTQVKTTEITLNMLSASMSDGYCYLFSGSRNPVVCLPLFLL